MIRIAAVLLLALGLVACTDATQDLAGPTEPMGNFLLGHAEVVTEKPAPNKLLVSRDATPEEWIKAVDGALETRFRRFEGDSYYHLGVKVIAYSLPPPIVPGKSALHVTATIYDDANCIKMNKKVHDVMVIQVFETRLELTREEQMQRLAETAAKDIEKWLREMMASDDWFTEDYKPASNAPKIAGGC
ncbi:hypothetical protein [Antarctobacter heliothermus]|uniref:Lipoprotein n=1 Tax=Antarctobacter heliothermus TaxID=74033 RepID=A0A239L6Q3_9RHOB|nr:hypothetical protein [Antarctobacter heliothermus]SNT26005.1 hypothetical protein SAMN04488078_108012 [Antarctobacter heliothermus]